MNPDFEELIDLTSLGPEERSRLERVHEMLVAAGPPAELPADLGAAPEAEKGSNVVALPTRYRRRTAVGALIAATVAAACFGGGYVLANQAHSSAIHAIRVVPMQGSGTQQNSEASLRVGSADGNGNWPLQLRVSGLQPLHGDQRYYLMVWQNGKPAAFCGTFAVSKTGSTDVTFSVAYKITKSTRWVVTKLTPGVKFPGDVVMTTVRTAAS